MRRGSAGTAAWGSGRVLVLLAALCLGVGGGGEARAQQGRLLATGGATPVEGNAGGGLVPWAVLAGYGTREETGATAFTTWVDTGDLSLSSVGAAVTFRNRIELSAAHLDFKLGTLGIGLGLPGQTLGEDVFGLKVRLLGDVLYTRAPQIAVGAQYKKAGDFEVARLVGARDDADVDLYVAASKVFLGGAAGRNLLVNATLRSTRANQLGLLGFGSVDDGEDGRDLVPEVSLALFLNPKTVIGVEYRDKPDQLPGVPEDAWADLFFGYFPNKHFAVVAAYADIGRVASLTDQTGFYLSVQGSF
jgi:hypothetical protein